MNQHFKRWLCVGLCTLLAAINFVPLVMADEGDIQRVDVTVVVQIEGIHQNLYYGPITALGVDPDSTITVKDVLKAADEMSDAIRITGLDTGYITAVNEDGSGLTADMWDGWLYRVNGVSAMVGINEYRVADGDHIVLYYSDEYKTGMQFPKVDDSCIAEGVLTFTDMTGETPAPVADMTVTWTYGDGETATYTTDANGSVAIDAAYLTVGDHVISVNRMTGNVPTVLRLVPGYTVTVPTNEAETTTTVETETIAETEVATEVETVVETEVATQAETVVDTEADTEVETVAETEVDTEVVTEAEPVGAESDAETTEIVVDSETEFMTADAADTSETAETTTAVVTETIQTTEESTTAVADEAAGCKAAVVSLWGAVGLAVAAACVAKRRNKA